MNFWLHVLPAWLGTDAAARLPQILVSTYLATVQIIGSLSVWLEDTPTSRAIASAEMVSGRSVAVLSLDPGNPSDCVVIAVWT